MSTAHPQSGLARRFSITLSPPRAAALRFRARQLEIPPTRLAGDLIDQAIDRLLGDPRWMEAWEQDAKQRAQIQAYERMISGGKGQRS